MMVIIIGKDGVEYCTVKKKDVDKHFFITRNQLYKIYPDAMTPLKVYHNGAWTTSDSVIVFEENGTSPYHCKYPKDYEMDSILSTIDEHKLMTPKKQGIKGFFQNGGGKGVRTLLEFMPWIIVGIIILFTVVIK